MTPPIRHDPYASLRIGNFRWFISSLLAMTVATQIQAVVPQLRRLREIR